MIPHKPLDLLIDEVISADIDYQEHERDMEAEQLWLKIEKEIDEQEDRE